jgi:diguanylate cyclase (GGDEF)-like protein
MLPASPIRSERGQKPRPAKVLIVEDEHIIAMDLQMALEGLGYMVIGTAASFDEAMELAALIRPDVVLLDIRLEGPRDGVELAVALRAQHQVPVVYLTANRDPSTMHRAVVTQPEGYLAKPFDERTLQSTIALALHKHAVADELRRAHEELHRRTRELSLLDELGSVLSRCQHEAQVVADLGAVLALLFPDDLCWVELGDSQGRHRASLAITDGDEVLGRLAFAEEGDAATVAERARMSSVVTQRIALTVANLRAKERLRREAISDALTGLYNRRHLDALFARELSQAQRHRRALGVMLIDLDHFKRLNDQFGHAAGDLVLREVAAALKTRVRVDDYLCRYGGEELAVLLPATDATGARVVAEALRKTIAGLELVHEGKKLPRVSASFGVAVFPTHGTTEENLLRAADRALYAAKAAGRNCVVVAEG